jgi:hypothetical protein
MGQNMPYRVAHSGASQDISCAFLGSCLFLDTKQSCRRPSGIASYQDGYTSLVGRLESTLRPKFCVIEVKLWDCL